MKIGSLFSGYGGLDIGVKNVIGGDVVWHCEFDKDASAVLEKNYPNIPNYGDITKIDWSQVEPIDVLTGGFPCQDVSLAGRRRGMVDGTRSGLWYEFARAIEELKPRLVVIENVRGLFTAKASSNVERRDELLADFGEEPNLTAIQAVLGSLSSLGYDAKWCGLRASDAGAPHARYRVFIIAYPNGTGGGWGTN